MSGERLYRMEAEARGSAWRARVLTGIQRFRFYKGELLAPSNRPYVVLSISQDEGSLPDLIETDMGILLIHERVSPIFMNVCPYDVQLVRVELHTSTGKTDRYCALNVLRRFEIEYLEHSNEYRPLSTDRFYFLSNQTVRMNLFGHMIAQDVNSQRLYVTERLKYALQAKMVTGLAFKQVKEKTA
ncbi:hypothetical protein ACFQO8_12790 [Exiguobacterium aestuarii]|uniref:Uncharacterized protein n=1 Tax=Exiguobacterium aestuarii TaxID=273527 RepID=A0ABW2PS52_9BACL|nr:hypothetical protein [Exiguobacterium aestuarii]MCT4786077.1 hypothetical protein [Exiguobacterium aestuarii]